MEVGMLSMRVEPPVRQRHHVVHARRVIDHQENIVCGSCQNFDSGVEFRSPCRLFYSRHYSVAVQRVARFDPNAPAGSARLGVPRHHPYKP
eukprot:8710188-Heterocapsa_arctica.AAC.1